MKKLQTILLVIFSIMLLSQDIWTQNLLEVEGELTINTASGEINVHGNRVGNVAEPSFTQDATTKAYVDNLLISFGVSIGAAGIQGLLSTGFSPATLISKGAPLTAFIGLNHAGGIIFYMNPNGDGTGLVAAPGNDNTIAIWGCFGTVISGADGTAIGTGNQNTTDIEGSCTATGIAASICANLSLNGFNDWFLPSKDELNEMHMKIGPGAAAPNTNIGNFSGFYWSSTEVNGISAWHQNFNDLGGDQNSIGKNLLSRVRAIRAF